MSTIQLPRRSWLLRCQHILRSWAWCFFGLAPVCESLLVLTWPMAKLWTFWDYIFSRENKVKAFISGFHSLSEGMWETSWVIWLVVSKIRYFHPDPWGRFPIWRAYFFKGVETTNKSWFLHGISKKKWSFRNRNWFLSNGATDGCILFWKKSPQRPACQATAAFPTCWKRNMIRLKKKVRCMLVHRRGTFGR